MLRLFAQFHYMGIAWLFGGKWLVAFHMVQLPDVSEEA